MSRTRAHLVLGAVMAGGCALAVTGWRVVEPARVGEALTSATPDTAERLVVTVAGLGLVLVGVWCAGAALVCSTDLLRAGRGAGRAGLWRPRPLRSLVLRACAPTVGVALLCGGAASAATDGERTPPPRPDAIGENTAALVGLPLPTRPVDRAGPAPTSAVTRTVRSGDCLWDIAEAAIGGRASPARIGRAWRVLYRANEARVGPDPDLVTPGLRLVVPPSLQPSPHRHR